MKIKSEILQKTSIGEQIKRQREATGMSQLDVSMRLGYKSNSLYYFESGKRDVTIGLLSELNRMFGWEFEV